MDCQIVHDSFSRRGLSDPYVLTVDGRVAGYGSVSNKYDKGAVDEFYLVPGRRADALPLFREFLAASQATQIRAQSNDRLLLLMLYDCAREIASDTILFEDAAITELPCPEGSMRKVTASDGEQIREQKLDADAEWMIESGGVAVATGGALFHYNPPYGDIYMAVAESHRRRGYGAYLVQELKRICYEIGKVPAARCNVSNTASRRTLQKAGFLPCARVLMGKIAE
jgi:GNAT superfamily N-acetyltransferase